MPNQKAIAVLILTAALIVVAVTWIFPVVGVRDSFCNSNPYAAGCR